MQCIYYLLYKCKKKDKKKINEKQKLLLKKN